MKSIFQRMICVLCSSILSIQVIELLKKTRLRKQKVEIVFSFEHE